MKMYKYSKLNISDFQLEVRIYIQEILKIIDYPSTPSHPRPHTIANPSDEDQVLGLFFFRDYLGNEIDLIIDKESGPQAIEIKSSAMRDRKLLSGLKYWSKYQPSSNGLLLYQGEDSETDNPLLNYISWKNLDQL